MGLSDAKHSECLYFRNGTCALLGIRVNPEGPVCPNFVPKRDKKPSPSYTEWLQSPMPTPLFPPWWILPQPMFLITPPPWYYLTYAPYLLDPWFALYSYHPIPLFYYI